MRPAFLLTCLCAVLIVVTDADATTYQLAISGAGLKFPLPGMVNAARFSTSHLTVSSTATKDSSQPAVLTDGILSDGNNNYNTWWSVSGAPSWLKLDLGAPTTITGVRVYTRKYGIERMATVYVCLSDSATASLDGAFAVMNGTLALGIDQWFPLIAPVSHQYVYLYQNGTAQLQLSEIEVYTYAPSSSTGSPGPSPVSSSAAPASSALPTPTPSASASSTGPVPTPPTNVQKPVKGSDFSFPLPGTVNAARFASSHLTVSSTGSKDAPTVLTDGILSDGTGNLNTWWSVSGAPSWLQLDLGAPTLITGVRVYTRLHMIQRMATVYVCLSDSATANIADAFGVMDGTAAFGIDQWFPLSAPVTKRFVYLYQWGTDQLQLSEIEVYTPGSAPESSSGPASSTAPPAPPANPQKPLKGGLFTFPPAGNVNAARFATSKVSASSTAHDDVSEVKDGILSDGTGNYNEWWSSGGPAWLQLDLGEPMSITGVRVYARGHLIQRMATVYVCLSDSPTANIADAFGLMDGTDAFGIDQWFPLSAPVTKRFVYLYQWGSEQLQLSELEVYTPGSAGECRHISTLSCSACLVLSSCQWCEASQTCTATSAGSSATCASGFVADSLAQCFSSSTGGSTPPGPGPQPQGTNVAHQAYPSISSILPGWGCTVDTCGAASAVDNNLNTMCHSDLVTKDSHEWLLLDFGTNIPVNFVRVLNRVDGLGPRLSADVFLVPSGALPAAPFYAELAAALKIGNCSSATQVDVFSFPVDPPRAARYVLLSQATPNYLHVREVEVYSTSSVTPVQPPSSTGMDSRTNYALAGVLTLSSTKATGECANGACVAAKGNDGNLDSFFSTTCGDGSKQWARLDLTGDIAPSTLVIYNRPAPYDGQISGAQLFLTATASPVPAADAFYTIASIDASNILTVQVPAGTHGQYLWVVQPTGLCVTLREIMVLSAGAPVADPCRVASGQGCAKCVATGADCRWCGSGNTCSRAANSASCSAGAVFGPTSPDLRCPITPTGVNVAVRGYATASSTFDGWGCAPETCGPALGNDDNLNTAFHTNGNSNTHEWWMLDLGRSVVITLLQLYNRQDDSSTANRIVGAQLFLMPPGSSRVSPPSPASAPATAYLGNVSAALLALPDGNIQFYPRGAEQYAGQFVWIVQSSTEFLHLREVRVFSAEQIPQVYPPPSNSSSSTGMDRFNAALGKPATMSSTWSTMTAALGVDGNVRNYFSTNGGGRQWWMVDLGANTPVTTITIFNRADSSSYASRINGAVVFLLTDSQYSAGAPAPAPNSTVGFVGTIPSIIGSTISLGVPGNGGRYLFVVQSTAEALNLAEVQAWVGGPKPDACLQATGRTCDVCHAIDGCQACPDGNRACARFGSATAVCSTAWVTPFDSCPGARVSSSSTARASSAGSISAPRWSTGPIPQVPTGAGGVVLAALVRIYPTRTGAWTLDGVRGKVSVAIAGASYTPTLGPLQYNVQHFDVYVGVSVPPSFVGPAQNALLSASVTDRTNFGVRSVALVFACTPTGPFSNTTASVWCPPQPTTQGSEGDKLSSGGVVGIVIAAVVVALAIGVALYYYSGHSSSGGSGGRGKANRARRYGRGSGTAGGGNVALGTELQTTSSTPALNTRTPMPPPLPPMQSPSTQSPAHGTTPYGAAAGGASSNSSATPVCASSYAAMPRL